LSGALTALAGGALSLAGSALAGSGVTIGGVRLAGFEVPNEVPWGTKMLLKEHTYPGGENIIQALGPTRKPISWAGQMIAPNATSRARSLDALASAGAQVQVAWGSLNFTGVIEDFDADYKHEWQGHYRITIRVLWDYSQAATAPDPVASVLSDLQQAASYAPLVTSVATALSGATAVQQGSTSTGTLQAVQGQIHTAQVGIGTSAAASGAMLSAGTPAPGNITAMAAAAGNTAGCATAWGYTARAGQNWLQVPGISTPNLTPQQSGADLTQYSGA
jgi:hypothetical protein